MRPSLWSAMPQHRTLKRASRHFCWSPHSARPSLADKEDKEDKKRHADTNLNDFPTQAGKQTYFSTQTGKQRQAYNNSNDYLTQADKADKEDKKRHADTNLNDFSTQAGKQTYFSTQTGKRQHRPGTSWWLNLIWWWSLSATLCGLS